MSGSCAESRILSISPSVSGSRWCACQKEDNITIMSERAIGSNRLIIALRSEHLFQYFRAEIFEFVYRRLHQRLIIHVDIEFQVTQMQCSLAQLDLGMFESLSRLDCRRMPFVSVFHDLLQRVPALINVVCLISRKRQLHFALRDLHAQISLLSGRRSVRP